MSELVTQSHGAPMTLDDKINYAEKLAASGLIPDTYKKNPPNVLVAVEKGEALGIHPMVALEEINVIHGRTSMSATLMMSLARSAGHTVRSVGDANNARCTIIRKDDPDFEHTVTWDQAKAQQNQLWGKGHWQKNPELMLKYRAISECVRMACPEVLAGVKYTPEEVVEITGPEYRESAAPAQPAPVQEDRSAVSPAPAQAKAQDAGSDLDSRIRQVLVSESADEVQSFGKWLRRQHPDHPALSRLIDRHTQLTQQAPQEATGPPEEPAPWGSDEEVVDAEIVPEHEAAQQSEPLFEEAKS